MDNFIRLSDLPAREILPGFHGKMIHTANLTVAHFQIDKGSILPEHHHVHEQITNVIKGELEMTMAGNTRICRAGDVVVIPSDLPHSARALTDCIVVDVFQPARDDYR